MRLINYFKVKIVVILVKLLNLVALKKTKQNCNSQLS